MPTFVIHALGHSSKKIAIPRGPIRVGRNPGSDLVLGHDTVSRDHAVFESDPKGNWTVSCLSETNPIVVDGKLISKRKHIREGSEILFGRGHLVIFSLNERKAQSYLGDGSSFVKNECPKCHWAGMLRDLGTAGTCPDCGSRELRSENAYVRDQEIGRSREGATAQISLANLGNVLQRIKTAKQSRIERIDDYEPARKVLGERAPIEIARGEDATLRLFGFTLGGSIRVAWNGAHFVAASTVWLPRMKVNGVRTSSAVLASDDVIEIGSNRFRFITEESGLTSLSR